MTILEQYKAHEGATLDRWQFNSGPNMRSSLLTSITLYCVLGLFALAVGAAELPDGFVYLEAVDLTIVSLDPEPFPDTYFDFPVR